MSVALGAATALLVVAQAWLLADVVDAGDPARRGRGGDVRRAGGAARGRRRAGARRVGDRGRGGARSARAKSAAARRAAGAGGARRARGHAGPAASSRCSPRAASTRSTRYFSRYLPQLLLAVIVPVVVLVAVVLAGLDLGRDRRRDAAADPGLHGARRRGDARAHRRASCAALQRLRGHFLDVVAGLPTLKVFGRAKAQAQAIAHGHRPLPRRARCGRCGSRSCRRWCSSCWRRCRWRSSPSRSACGCWAAHLGPARPALFVLVLAPEAYLPLRALGANYHASAEGVAAAEQVSAVLDAPLPAARGTRSTSPTRRSAICASRGCASRYPGRGVPALDGVSLTRRRRARSWRSPGRSGCGKSTLLRRAARARGAGRRDGAGRRRRPRASSTPRRGAARLAWVPAAPAPVRRRRSPTTSGSGAATRRDEDVAAALAAAGLAPVLRRLPARRSRPCSASAAPGCRPASASASRSPARSCATRRCCCSTSRPRTSTATPRPRCSTRSGGWRAGGRCARRPPPGAARRSPTASSGSTVGAGGGGVSAEPRAPLRDTLALARPAAGRLASGDAARRRLGGGGDRADRDVGVADLARVAAARASRRSRSASSAVQFFALSRGAAALRRAAGRPRRRVPRARRRCASASTAPRARSPRRRCRPSAAATCSRGSSHDVDVAAGPAAARRAAVRDRGRSSGGDRRAGVADCCPPPARSCSSRCSSPRSLVPWLTGALAGRAEARQAAARGELTAAGRRPASRAPTSCSSTAPPTRQLAARAATPTPS